MPAADRNGTPTGTLSVSGSFYIGLYASTYYWNGSLADISVWSGTVLSAAQVLAHCQAAKGSSGATC